MVKTPSVSIPAPEGDPPGNCVWLLCVNNLHSFSDVVEDGEYDEQDDIAGTHTHTHTHTPLKGCGLFIRGGHC